jgi:hypothetical protein
MFDDDQDPPELRMIERRDAERAPVEEAGGGEAEGFEQAEELLIEHASHGDQHGTEPITHDARVEAEGDPGDEHGEADHVGGTEV